MFDCNDQIHDSIKLMIMKFNELKQEELLITLNFFGDDRITCLSYKNRRERFFQLIRKVLKIKNTNI
jgi:hypothetical protein